jgi:hypothetical protein
LKRFIPELNMPLRFLTCGALVLAVNVAVPFFYRSVMETDVARWQKPSYYFWFLLLPLLQLLANLLPRPTQDHDLAPKRSWLPLLMFELWIAATALNLWAIDYVSKLDFRLSLVAPALWALGWTIYHRLGDIVPGREVKRHAALLVLPVFATVPSALHHNSQLFVVLTSLNLLLLGRLFLSKRHPQAAFQLFLLRQRWSSPKASNQATRGKFQ